MRGVPCELRLAIIFYNLDEREVLSFYGQWYPFSKTVETSEIYGVKLIRSVKDLSKFWYKIFNVNHRRVFNV